MSYGGILYHEPGSVKREFRVPYESRESRDRPEQRTRPLGNPKQVNTGKPKCGCTIMFTTKFPVANSGACGFRSDGPLVPSHRERGARIAINGTRCACDSGL